MEFVPFGDLLGYLRKVRGVQDSCYFDADHQPKTKLCTSQELMKFAIESAQGMEYLSMKKVMLNFPRVMINYLHSYSRHSGRFKLACLCDVTLSSGQA